MGFFCENNHMMKQDLMNITICSLQPLRVIFRECVFKDPGNPCSKQIQQTFQFLREWSACMGLNPAELIEVGVPVIKAGRLAAYTCCLEYVLPAIDESAPVSLGELPGGTYAVLRVENSPACIEQAVWQFQTGYLPEHALTQDPCRPVYEIFHGQDLEYCIPLIK